VGDIHGCARELERLIVGLRPEPDDRFVFLGDYVDRGPASASVVSLLLEIQQTLPKSVFLRGNHEDMLLDFLGLDGKHGEAFVSNGGIRTLASYGVDPPRAPSSPEAIRSQLPADHIAFFTATTSSFREGPWTFVHAGVRPGLPLEEQSREDLLWIREDFLRHEHDLDTTIVFGHTPQRRVLFDVPQKIGLDTGLVYGGRLSCLDLSNTLLHQVEYGGNTVQTQNVRKELSAVRPRPALVQS
jgi:serine/threonine protein phosphatase 1